MNVAENHKQKNELVDWLGQTDWTVFGTLKFTDGQDISAKKAEADLKKYFNKLDRTYLGSNMVDAGHRIQRVVFSHLGTCGSNIHFHFVAKPDAEVGRFCETARLVWQETSNFTMGYENTKIEAVDDASAVTRYCLHEYNRLGPETLYLPATHCAAAHPKPKPIHKLRRLLKRHERNCETRGT
jgi:hypothetical protein